MNQGKLIDKNVFYQLSYSDYRKEIRETVILKGKKSDFFFDTGAPFSISQELQDIYQFKIIHKAQLNDINNKKSSITIVEVDTIAFGGMRFVNVPALVLDFKNTPLACENYQGIIGSNLVRFLIIQFDLQKEKVIFTDDVKRIEDMCSSGLVFVDGQSNAYMQVAFNNIGTSSNSFYDTAHFDSGMRNFYDMNKNKAEAYISYFSRDSAVIRKGTGTTAMGILGEASAEQQYVLKAPIVNLGKTGISDLRINTTNTTSRIGRELLQYGKLTINYPAGNYCFVPYSARPSAEKSDFGFSQLTADGKVRASIVWENSAAWKKGLNTGDEIVAINGIDLKNKSSCEIDKLVKKELDHNEIVIVFSRNGALKKATLQKEKF